MRRILCAITFGILLCAGSGSVFAAVTTRPGDGVVMARLVASRGVGNYSGKWQALTVRNVATKKKHRLTDQSPRASVQSVFVASLPPGNYEVVKVDANHVGYFFAHEEADFDRKLFTFVVAAERVTNLGTIVYLRPYNPLNTLVFRWVFEPDAELPKQLAFALDERGKALTAAETLGWTATGTPVRSRLTPEVKHLSMVLAGRILMSDGTLVSGENFGQISRRDPAGKWSWEDTGLIDTIQAAVDMPDKSAYAAADNSVLLRRDAGGFWHRLEVPLAAGLPRFLGVDDASGLFTVWEQDEGVTVLVAKDAKNPVWTTTKTIKPRVEFFGNTGPVRSWVMQAGTHLVVAVTTAKAFSYLYDLNIFDKTTNEWSVRQLKAYGPIGAFADGTLYTITGPNIRQKFKTSSDWGQTWEDGGTTSLAGLPLFRSRLEGYMVRPGPALWRTLDGGKTWQQHADLPPLFATMIALSGEQMLLVTANGKLFFSPDNGKTMTLERDSTQTLF